MMWLELLMLELQFFFFIKRWDLWVFAYCQFFVVSFSIFKKKWLQLHNWINSERYKRVGTSVALATGDNRQVFIPPHLFHLVDMILRTSNLPDQKICLLPKLWSMTEPEGGEKAASLKAVVCGSGQRRREIIHSSTLQDCSLRGNKTRN